MYRSNVRSASFTYPPRNSKDHAGSRRIPVPPMFPRNVLQCCSPIDSPVGCALRSPLAVISACHNLRKAGECVLVALLFGPLRFLMQHFLGLLIHVPLWCNGALDPFLPKYRANNRVFHQHKIPVWQFYPQPQVEYHWPLGAPCDFEWDVHGRGPWHICPFYQRCDEGTYVQSCNGYAAILASHVVPLLVFSHRRWLR